MCIPTCFADLVPTALAMTTFENGPYFSRASRKIACFCDGVGLYTLESLQVLRIPGYLLLVDVLTVLSIVEQP